MRKRSFGSRLFSTIVVLLVLALVGYVALTLVNDRVQDELDTVIRSSIIDMDLQDFVGFSSIEVDAARGQVGLKDIKVSLPSGDTNIFARDLTIRVSPLELAAVALNPDTATLKNVDIKVTSFRLDDSSNMGVSFENVIFALSGDVSVSNPEGSSLTRAVVTGTGMQLQDKQSGISFSANDVDLQMFGDFTMESLNTIETDPLGFLDDMQTLSVNAQNGAITLSQEQVQGLQMVFGFDSWVNEASNWTVQNVSMDMQKSEDNLKIQNIALEMPIIKASGSSSIPLDMENLNANRAVELSVESLNEGIRTQLTPFIGMLGQQLPAEGPFTFTYEQNGLNFPRVIIE
jgi:hypothetical protein